MEQDLFRKVKSDEICVVCGRYVPEGLMVCPMCMARLEEEEKKNDLDRICSWNYNGHNDERQRPLNSLWS